MWLREMPTEQLARLLEDAGQVPDNIRAWMREAARRLRKTEKPLDKETVK